MKTIVLLSKNCQNKSEKCYLKKKKKKQCNQLFSLYERRWWSGVLGRNSLPEKFSGELGQPLKAQTEVRKSNVAAAIGGQF